MKRWNKVQKSSMSKTPNPRPIAKGFKEDNCQLICGQLIALKCVPINKTNILDEIQYPWKSNNKKINTLHKKKLYTCTHKMNDRQRKQKSKWFRQEFEPQL